MKLNSHAKINMFLHVIGRYENGYHEISSLIVFLKSLYDEILISDAKNPSVLFENYDISKDNTVSKALSLIGENGFNNNFAVQIKKNIPIASGMGGGSANAAKILNHLSLLYEINEKIVFEIGCKIGLDVIVCLKNKASLVENLGEKIINFTLLPRIFVVIVNNKKELLSYEIYKKYREEKNSFSKKIDNNTLAQGDLLEQIANLSNDLQPIAVSIMPEIDEILYEIKSNYGCVFSRMSGSGPTCFGAFYSEDYAKIAEKKLQSKYPEYCVLYSEIF